MSQDMKNNQMNDDYNHQHHHSLLNTNSKPKANRQQSYDNLNCLPVFKSVVPYTGYLINRSTSPFTMITLIELAQQTKVFTINTMNHFSLNKVALIQIEYVQSEPVIVLIEMFHLPGSSHTVFHQIQILFGIIFHSTKCIQAWGDVMSKLKQFIEDGLFNSVQLNQIHPKDVQQLFKPWYNKTFDHDNQCSRLFDFEDDQESCTCPHRPYKNPNDTWSLSKAMAMTFERFLDQSLDFSPWAMDLDPLFGTYISEMPMYPSHEAVAIQHEEERLRCHRRRLVQYAVNNCLAVSTLSIVIENEFNEQQLGDFIAQQPIIV